MKKIILLLLIAFLINNVHASDSLIVTLNRTQFIKGDTLSFRCDFPNYTDRDSLTVGTMHVWIENIQTNEIWKYRYPILRGTSIGTLILSGSIPDGNYAINFLLQKEFFKVTGTVRDYKVKEKAINFFMYNKNENSYADQIKPSENGSFQLPNLLFQDTAFFIFAYSKKGEWKDLYINLQTPLDSAFIPSTTLTKIISVGNSINKIENISYQFDYTKTFLKTTLPEVTVSTVHKKQVDLYDEQYSHDKFQTEFVWKVFDGLESDQFARYNDIYRLLGFIIPGLRVETIDGGAYAITWRGSRMYLFLDEFELPYGGIIVNPADIAMIKVYEAPSNLSSFRSGYGGAIAIYTKRGKFDNNPDRKYKFKVAGYTAPEIVWK